MAEDDDRQLSEDWRALQEAGEVPEVGKGETAERAKRDEARKRKRMPSEAGRQKIAPTLSPKLIRRLRAICKAQGHIGKDGEGIIASSVIEDLLAAAVEAYERGEFDLVEEVVEVQQRLRRKAR